MKKVPVYFNSNLKLEFNGKCARLTDRARVWSLLPSILMGALLFMLGLYEWMNMFADEGMQIVPISDVPLERPAEAVVWFFDGCFMLIGLGIVVAGIVKYFQYGKYIIKGNEVTVIRRCLLQGKKVFQGKLQDYSGVRFRMEFHQSGFLLKTLYILELYQRNVDKIVPLYIAATDCKLRHIWKDYAKKFKLPALINTDEGVKQYTAGDLSRSVRSLYKQGVIEDKFDDYSRLPSAIAYVRKKDKIVIKIRKIIWDIFNLFAWVGLFIVLLIAGVSIKQIFEHGEAWKLPLTTLVACLMIIFVMLQFLFRKEKLVLKKNKIVHTHKYMLFSTKHNQMMKKDVEAIEVMENPATGRCFLAIISDDNAITFGAKLSKKNLSWVKRFLIHDIIK